MLGSDELQKYDRARVFLDEDYTAADKFTVSTLPSLLENERLVAEW